MGDCVAIGNLRVRMAGDLPHACMPYAPGSARVGGSIPVWTRTRRTPRLMQSLEPTYIVRKEGKTVSSKDQSWAAL
jgi:hypothetical protein